ncbi:CMP-N-acetylneuraminate-beta-galactosamide-alpha-2,3-sialyltransferase 1-like isoform X2 [Betta splendens]|uniref:CMP-N-acetylneuraminate-beta-galactosamide-alpha-2,3-sialyltransferase 1 n=1 Tax=Betta splendens TaxID=158456 RepID=A0A6P7P0W4_BETSP|nr:CMP-N-acetylneuraminate-beta-galactosamide-alpha-2,3-sialyltransferase 1-like isoform X2 [Betta splendens]
MPCPIPNPEDPMAGKKPTVSLFVILMCVTAIGVFLMETDSKVQLKSTFQPTYVDPCSCGKCLSENDTWFMKRFNESEDPFLSEHFSLSAAAFSWWRLLQGERCSFLKFKNTVNALFQIFPPNPHVLEPRPERCRTCAVVGNSINLKGSGYGRLIDHHDVIIRINYGPTKGFEADVGNRTTHRVMYPESSMDLDDTTHLILFPFKLRDLEWLIRVFTARFPGKKYGSLKSVMTGNKDLVMVLNPTFMKYVHESWLDMKGKYPSTGFITLILALHICGEVDVFGYGADKDGNWSHYFEKLTSKTLKTGVHPGLHEYEVIGKLARKRKITFFSGRHNL